LYLRGRGFIIIPELTGERIEQAASQGSQIWGVLKVILNSYLFYIKELVFPFSFNAFIGTVPGGGYYLVSSVLVLSLLCVIGLASVKRKEGVTAFSIFWILITISPSCIIAISRFAATPLAERYLYIPSAGYCLLLGYLILKMGNAMKVQKIAWGIGFLIIISYLFFTVERQGVWRNNLALWEDSSKKSPNQFLPHLNYGGALKEVGRNDEAIREFQVIIDPRVTSSKRQKARASGNIGVIYGIEGDFTTSEEWLLKSINYDPRYGRPYYHLGLIYVIRGDRGDSSAYVKAEEYLKRTVKIYPNFGRAYLVLAKLYVRLRENDKARENAKKALRTRLNQSLTEDAEYILKIMN
ncbi:MAG: tetratricopeptide repeat protein, partial [Thermodesulfobacteriota bacterium]